MFIQVQVLKREGANVPPTVVQEVLRVDLIQRMREIEVSDWDEVCTELILDNEETIVCQGSLRTHLEALDELFG
jgi:hypothetical protein